jgi:hypothetical protein
MGSFSLLLRYLTVIKHSERVTQMCASFVCDTENNKNHRMWFSIMICENLEFDFDFINRLGCSARCSHFCVSVTCNS